MIFWTGIMKKLIIAVNVIFESLEIQALYIGSLFFAWYYRPAGPVLSEEGEVIGE